MTLRLPFKKTPLKSGRVCVCVSTPIFSHTPFCYGAHNHDTFEGLDTVKACLLKPVRVAVSAGDVNIPDSSENADLGPKSM